MTQWKSTGQLNAELYHHGILGMHWGIRRYQPYGSGGYNPNGDGARRKAKRKKVTIQDINNDLDDSIQSNKEVYKRITNVNSNISDASDKLGEEYRRAFEDAELDDSAKKRIIKKLKDDFGVGADDEEYFNLIKEEYVNDELMSMVNDAVLDKRKSFDKMLNQYWNDVDSIVSSIKEKYSDAKIEDKFYKSGRHAVNDLIGEKLNTRLSSYITKHFDDYWVMDTEGYQKALERLNKDFDLTMDEYNNKYAH